MRLWLPRLIALSASFSAAAIMLLLAPHWLHGVTRIVLAYDAGGLIFLILSYTQVRRSAEDTRKRAEADDPGRKALMSIVLGSAIMGMISAIITLGMRDPRATTAQHVVELITGFAAVGIAWTLIHTVFLFRYAHLYYYDDDDDDHQNNGLEFPGDDPPSDYDFAYFSFVLGMTYQVSDVQITNPGIRRVALAHSLISFVFNTFVVALVVSIVASLLH